MSRELKTERTWQKIWLYFWGIGTKQQKEALKYISRVYCKKCPPYKKRASIVGEGWKWRELKTERSQQPIKYDGSLKGESRAFTWDCHHHSSRRFWVEKRGSWWRKTFGRDLFGERERSKVTTLCTLGLEIKNYSKIIFKDLNPEAAKCIYVFVRSPD